MKRKIALLLALVMVLSMVPMMSFAASSNRISKVPTVTDDHPFGMGDAPQLVIEEKDTDWGADEQTIRLKLENADWLYRNTVDVTDSVYAGTNDYTSDFEYVKVTQDSDSTVTVNFKTKVDGLGNRTASPKMVLRIPMYVETTDLGDVTVEIDARDSEVTSGIYTFAKAGEGSAVVTIDGDVTLSQGSEELKTIEINETHPGAYNSVNSQKTVKLKLSSGFIWDDAPTVTFSNEYGASTGVVGTPDDETLEITFAKGNLIKTTSRGTIFIKGGTIKAEMDANYGDVTMRVSGSDVETTTLKVAKYKDYGVIVKADGDAKELVAGKFEKKNDEAHELQKLIIKEDIAGSWLTNRRTEIEFPSWVKIRGIEESGKKNISGDVNYSYDRTGNKVELTFNKSDGDKKSEIELTFFVSVEADATGDIVANVSGKAIDEEHKIVLGKAIAPIEVTTDVKDVRIGVQKQELGKITLTENLAGAFKKGGDVEVKLDADTRWTEDPVVKVVDGEGLKIDRVKTKDGLLSFRVVRESDKPSTIEITGGEVDLYRTLPEGNLKVFVGGDALVENANDRYNNYPVGGIGEMLSEDQFDYATFKTDWVAEPVVAKVVTPAPGEVVEEAVTLTIGVVPEGGDVAPYIKDARTFAPVSAVAQALGVDKSNILWNAENRTVTILGEKTVQMTIGSKTLLVNGVAVEMDVAAEITNDRTFLPIAWLAKALDVQYTWDAATQSVTFY